MHPPLALHGALGGPADWDALRTRVPELESPVLWSLEGNLPTLGNRLAETHPDRALLGYSMGGRIALHALLSPAARWTSAVLVSAHPGLESAEARAARRESDEGWARDLEDLPPDEFWQRWQAQSVFADEPDRPAPDLEPAMARSFREWSLGAQEPLWDRLGEIEVPVTWIVGERDTKFRQLGERAVSLLPRAHLVVVPGCGHSQVLKSDPGTHWEISQRG